MPIKTINANVYELDIDMDLNLRGSILAYGLKPMGVIPKPMDLSLWSYYLAYGLAPMVIPEPMDLTLCFHCDY